MLFNATSSSRDAEENDTPGRDMMLFSLSQNTSSVNNASYTTSPLKSIISSRKPKQTLEPPCLPVTVSLLHYAWHQKNTSKIEFFNMSGPVSLVGWPVDITETTLSNPNESEFQFSDGSGILSIRVPLYSETEEWLLQKFKKLLGVPNRVGNVTQQPSISLCYLRVIGTMSLEANSQIALRCIHARRAEYEEVAFYHTIDVVAICLLPRQTLLSSHKHGSFTTTQFRSSDNNPRTMNLDKVQLPETFLLCETNKCQLSILQYIMKNREKQRGVERRQLIEDLSSIFEKQDLEENIDALNDMAFCMETVTGYLDVVIDEDVV